MILIGSKALEAHSALPRWRGGKTSDTDYIGTVLEYQFLVSRLKRLGLYKSDVESKKYPGKYKIETTEGIIEFDATDNESNRLFERLEDNVTVKVFGLWLTIPSLKTLYLVKRSHVNYPINWHKNFKDLVSIANHARVPCNTMGYWREFFGSEAMMLYASLRNEANARYTHLQDKIKLNMDEAKFFDRSKSVRSYVHDDIHKVIAWEEGHPQYEQYKTKLDSPLLSETLFNARSYDRQKMLFMEEACVVGIERFYLPDRTLAANKVYRAGAAKLLHTMTKGWFQDFGLDHIHLMQPDWPFLERFETALEQGKIREQ